MSESLKECVRVIAFQEGDKWVAQCVEFDICAQGSDLDQLQRRMEVALELECELSTKATGKPFGGLDPAPSHYAVMFDEATSSLNGDIEMRIAA